MAAGGREAAAYARARIAAITWKRAKLAGRDFSHLPVTRERAEHATADDVAFLSAHLTRTKRGSS
jgi:hypothetical protein